MRRQSFRLACLPCPFLLLAMAATPAFATDHFNLEWGIPTSLEDIVALERGKFELQGFSRYMRLKGKTNRGLAQPRLAYGIFEQTQLEIESPFLLGQGAASGNGDIQISMLRMLRADRQGAWLPGVALEADVSLPTGTKTPGFKNQIDAGLTLIMKKDVGPHSFHFNAEFDWTCDQSEEEHLRSAASSIAIGHDMPLTKRLLLVSDVVWRQSDDMGEKDVPLFETGVRAQLTRSLIGAIGVGIGLNRGAETPAFSLTVGFQFGL